jgi:endonuclease YncB( thermonuclease family)
MKKILLLATAFVLTLAVKAQTDATTKTTVPQQKVDDVIKMNVETHDFGKVKQGIPVTYDFEIRNISDKPVVVENTWASCGCTTPDKITEPILPGKTVKLKVQYNSAAVAPINKDVSIKLAGIDQPKVVHITGEVLAVDAYEAYMKEKGEVPAKNEATPAKNATTPAKTTTPTISPVKQN